jgi:ABC-type antimicrobial peptide transport system permease subunit
MGTGVWLIRSRLRTRWAAFAVIALVARFTKPVRPAEIINARAVRSAPLLVGGLLVIAATVGLAAAVIISVRVRRREMAVLRTLGFTGRQLRVSVKVQALAMMLGGFVVGAPLGVAMGRIAWQAFASRLGVVTASSTPIGWIIATGAGAALVAMLAAAGPARVAGRTNPAVALRSE